jgi:hypothetical protein
MVADLDVYGHSCQGRERQKQGQGGRCREGFEVHIRSPEQLLLFLKRRLADGRVCIYNRLIQVDRNASRRSAMKKGFFSRFGRSGEVGSRPGLQVDKLAPGVVPRAEAAARAAAGVAEVVRGIARKGLPRTRRKSAISLRLDPEFLTGSGTRDRLPDAHECRPQAYMDASGA